MVYQNKLAAAVKVNGKVLRENAGTVLIPFGSEYSILVKNLNSVRVMVKVHIDGDEVTEPWLIVEPNSSIELERWVKSTNLEKGNRFKFIERTKPIEEYRGIQIDDGLIRIEYKTEQRVQPQPIVRFYEKWVPIQKPYVPYSTWYEYPYTYTNLSGSLENSGRGTVSCNNLSRSVGAASAVEASGQFSCNMTNFLPQSDAGITVPGSESNQKFVSGAWFPTESQSDVLVLNLRGEVNGKPIEKPVTVNQKLTCSSCGMKSNSMFQFCARCGTALEII